MQSGVHSAFAVFCLTVLSVAVSGQSQHPLTNIPPAGDVQTSYVLPDHPSKQFPAGDQIPILVGFHNAAYRDFNVSYILGSINLPENNMFIQNFSYHAYFQSVPSGEEATFEYNFRPDKSLHPMELRVALTMFYGDAEGEMYASTFFNETIDIVEKPKLIDYEMLFMYVVLLGLAGAAGYAILSWVAGLAGGKKRQPKRAAGKATDESRKDDWLAGTPAAKIAKAK